MKYRPRRKQKYRCPQCRRIFFHRAGVVFCSHRCQDKNWRARHPEKAKSYALTCYYRHRKKYIRASTARQRVLKADPVYRARVNAVMRAWYAKNRKRLCVKERARYAALKAKRKVA
jgi:hypothetical protein